jgi:hypothetical protein
MKTSLIANFGQAARADSFQNRRSGSQIALGSQNFISGFAAKLFVSSAGWNKRSAGATNLIMVDIAFLPVFLLVFGRIIGLHALQKITNLERPLSSPDPQRTEQFSID